jgi:hypothetical protein
MVVLVDNNKAMEISIREWDEENTQYGPDWAADFFDVGSLPQIPNLSDYTDADLAELGLPKRTVIQLDDVVEPSGRFIDGIGTFGGDDDGYVVDDVDYCSNRQTTCWPVWETLRETLSRIRLLM